MCVFTRVRSLSLTSMFERETWEVRLGSRDDLRDDLRDVAHSLTDGIVGV